MAFHREEDSLKYVVGEVPPLPVNVREVRKFNQRGVKALRFNKRGSYTEKTFYISENMKYLKFRSGWHRLWSMTKSKCIPMTLLYSIRFQLNVVYSSSGC